MRVLLRFRVIGVAESDFVRQVGNRVLVPDNAMPALGGASPTVAPQVFRFFSSRVSRCISRIDAKIDDLKIVCDAHSQFLERLDQTVVDQRAEHRATIVRGHKNSRLFCGRVAETELLTIFVAENQIVRELQARVLFQGYTAEIARRKRTGRPNKRYTDPQEKNNDFHRSFGIWRRGGLAVSDGRACIRLRGVWPVPTGGRPPSSSNCIAPSIGIRAIPDVRSTQP